MPLPDASDARIASFGLTGFESSYSVVVGRWHDPALSSYHASEPGIDGALGRSVRLLGSRAVSNKYSIV